MRRLAHAVLGLALVALALAAFAPAMPTVTLEWATASELNTAGFRLYRGTSPAGPFTLVTPSLIPAADPLTGNRYRHIDGGVQAGRVYYYQLEDVENDGTATRHGPLVVRASWLTRPRWLVAAAVLGVAWSLLFWQQWRSHLTGA